MANVVCRNNLGHDSITFEHTHIPQKRKHCLSFQFPIFQHFSVGGSPVKKCLVVFENWGKHHKCIGTNFTRQSQEKYNNNGIYLKFLLLYPCYSELIPNSLTFVGFSIYSTACELVYNKTCTLAHVPGQIFMKACKVRVCTNLVRVQLMHASTAWEYLTHISAAQVHAL